MQRTFRLFFLASLAGTGFAASVGAASPTASASDAREPQISGEGPSGEYLKRIHERFHGRWTEPSTTPSSSPGGSAAAARSRASSPMAGASAPFDSTGQVTVALAIRWDGSIADVTLKSGSGAPDFDRRATETIRQSAPYPLPPQDVVSDDGYAHIEWTFARDYRACSAGARVARVEDPIDVSLPRLIERHRVSEAVRRVGEAINHGAPDALDRFARLFLARAIPDPVLDVEASAALASTGDRGQIARLSSALASRATAATAAVGLHRLGIDICAALLPTLETGTRVAREVALETLRAQGHSGTDLSNCSQGLSSLLADGHQPVVLRLLALDTITTYLPASAKAAIASAMRDIEPAIRGAGVFASVRKGGGRPEMYRLAPLLHDRAVEVRAAASAGIVRAAGDLALDQLYLLGRESDPRPAQAVAAELARLNSAASAEFLGKMLKRSNPAVQLAATRALVARHDAAAKAQLGAGSADLPAEARALLGAASTASGAGLSAPPAPAGAAVAASPDDAPATEQVERLLRDNHPRDAASWIVGHWGALPPSDAIAVLGTWLARASVTAATERAVPAAAAAAVSTPTPAHTPTPAPTPPPPSTSAATASSIPTSSTANALSESAH